MSREDHLIASIEEDLRLQKEASLLKPDNLGSEWARRMLVEPRVFLEAEVKLKPQALKDFRVSRYL